VLLQKTLKTVMSINTLLYVMFINYRVQAYTILCCCTV